MELWNTFENVRERLADQYRHETFNPESGMPREELEAKCFEYLSLRPSLPLIRRKAGLFAMILDHTRIGVDPADWFADHMESRGILYRCRDSFCGCIAELNAANRKLDEAGIGYAQLDLSHTSPDWHSILELGVSGLRNRAAAALENAPDSEAREFYAAAVTVYDAMRRFLLRLAAEARRVNAVRVVAALEALADRPPQTFQQALQLTYLYNQLQEIEGEAVRSNGTFDRLFLPFYRADLAAGRLTRDQAEELVKFYWNKFHAQHNPNGKNFCFGGAGADSELGELAFEVYRELALHDPKLALRLSHRMPDRLARQAAEFMKQGLTAVVFANDDIAELMFRKRGKAPGDLDDFVLIGCYEPAIMGREISCTMEAMCNLAKPVEQLFGEPELPQQFDAFRDAYFRILRQNLRLLMEYGCRFEEKWPAVNPSPLLSATMPECIRKGRDISSGGALYNPAGVMCAGLADAADSFAVIRTLVFEKRLCTMAELKTALDANWEGYDDLRFAALRQAPKWGNNDDAVDQFAVEIAAFAADTVNRTPNRRGGAFQLGLWSIDLNNGMGRRTGALPSGRRSGEPLARNLGSSIGMDRNGATALIRSAAKLDHTEFPDGSVLDILLHPSALDGPEGAQLPVDLVRTYFKLGGLAIQFNIFNAETLRKARREPEKYQNLQVRVCGWNARFVDLGPEEQEAFIARAEAMR